MKNIFCSQKRPFFRSKSLRTKRINISQLCRQKNCQCFFAPSPTKFIGMAFYSKVKISSFIPVDTTIPVSTPLSKNYCLKIRENCASNFMLLSSETPPSNHIEDWNAILTTLPEAVCQKSETICSHSERNVIEIF